MKETEFPFAETLTSIRSSGGTVLVVGLGITGVETARYLAHDRIPVVCVERQTEELFRAKSKLSAQVDALREAGVTVLFGVDGERVAPHLNGVELAVLSPGVPLESSIVGAIVRAGVPYVGELELGMELHGGRSVVVTGSNGKSTTVSLIDHILRCAAIPSFLCGNVGTPVIASSEICKDGSLSSGRSTLVVEASSYQLEACTVMKPAVSVVLNITDNHLERHGTIERYAAAKARALQKQSELDVAVLNADDPIVRGLGSRTRARAAFFGTKSAEELSRLSPYWAAISYVPGGSSSISVSWPTELAMNGRPSAQSELESYDVTNAHLLGLHNRYNIAAAILAVRALGVSREVINTALLSFSPLEHRLEVVGEGDWGIVINDSKSTTVAASLAAFTTLREHYAGRPLTLMLGGLSKAGSWDPLLSAVRTAGPGINPIVCFGKDGPLLASHCKAKSIPHVVAATLRDAVSVVRKSSSGPKDVILLSPGCASYDEFTDFENRGAEFKRYVREVG